VGVATLELRRELASSITSLLLRLLPSSKVSRDPRRDTESCDELELRREEVTVDDSWPDSNDFLRSWMVKEEDREAGRPQGLALLGELVSSGGSSPSALRRSSVLIPTVLGELFLHALSTFCRLMASTEFFFSTLWFAWSPAFVLAAFSLSLGDCVGEEERPDREDRPEDTAESLSESSVLCAGEPGRLSSEFLLPMGGLVCAWDSSFFVLYTVNGFLLKAGLYLGNSWSASFSLQGGLGRVAPPPGLAAALPPPLLLCRALRVLRSLDPSVTSGITRPFNLLIVLRRRCSIRDVMDPFLEEAEAGSVT